MEVMIRPCSKNDLDALQGLSYTTFNEAFGPLNSQETMSKYLEKAFNKNKLQKELSDTNCNFFFLFQNNELAGYLKINESPSQTDINDPKSIELERIYIRNSFAGKGLGSRLMNHAIQLAEKMNKFYVWLGVWEKNVNAISFYKKMGFIEAGYHSFKMGDELQNDLIMKKQIRTNT